MTERQLQAALETKPDLIRPDLVRLYKKFPVAIEPWIGKEESTVPWDPYKHRPKEIDLLLFDKRHRCLILCELKCRASEGEGGLMQLVDYWYMLSANSAAQERVRVKVQELGDIPNKLFEDARLYLIIAGHVSELLKKRVGYLKDNLVGHLTIFEALPQADTLGRSEPSPQHDLEIRQVLPATPGAAQPAHTADHEEPS